MSSVKKGQLVSAAAVTWQAGLGTLAGKAGKRLWMSEYASGAYAVTDIKTGLALSAQVCHPSTGASTCLQLLLSL